MRALRSLLPLLLVGGLLLTGCDDDSDATESPSSSRPADVSPDEDGPDAGEPATGGANFADCSAITAEEMAPLLGEGSGTAEVPPVGGSCSYSLEDPELPSVSLEQFTTADFAEGWDGAVAHIANTVVGDIDGTPVPLSGVGDDAVAVHGVNEIGGGVAMTIGLVLVEDTIVRATVPLGYGLSDTDAITLMTKVLTLVASKA